MKITAFLLLALLLCAFEATNLTRDEALESLANAERNFSATSEAKGLHHAFVEHMAEDGLVFSPKPTNAKKLHAAAPASTAYLSWYPAYADISNSLDWGYTTGPYKLKPSAEDDKVVGAGFYLSVWGKQPDGQWKVAIDMGNSFSPNLLKEETYQPTPANPKAKKVKGAKEDLLSKDVQKVQPYFTETLIYRHGEYPYKYKDGVIEPASNVVYTNLGHELSPAADMAYTYGSYTQPTSKGEVAGHYLKVWRVLYGQWKLVAHNLVPDKK
ncbi:ketosteroid isomerase-like protein [Pontibacter aydingkolensis]|uniref:DUF4440 domain-containing protein n=1 Tax=Pontibacter aydingkolensis TaxID=1911536 RepID=A0ABS7CQM5_9BACT|nr:hypothetical protein [Pontibacter aydingkolensis]MBW7466124.1 hypothetical protein [Pontibacter aydingkolensis]